MRSRENGTVIEAMAAEEGMVDEVVGVEGLGEVEGVDSEGSDGRA